MCENLTELPVNAAYSVFVLKGMVGGATCEELTEKLSETLSLNLDATGISETLPVVRALPKVERLLLRDNHIQIMRQPHELTKLRLLDLSYNNIRSWGELGSLETEDRWILGQERQDWNLGRTEFIRLCSQFEKQSLEVQNTLLAMLDALGFREGECVNANFELLRRRHLELKPGRGIRDLSPFRGLSTLTSLDLSEQAIESLEVFREISGIEELILDGNAQVKDLSPLRSQRTLKVLSLKKMGIEDVSWVQALPRLQVLKVHGNRIQNWDFLQSPGLRALELHGRDQQQQ
jgi:Leucine-rich repeat (LRR) protein